MVRGVHVPPVVEKKYVPEDILKLLETEPVMLPPWDPMFAEEL